MGGDLDIHSKAIGKVMWSDFHIIKSLVPEAQRNEQYLTDLDMSVTWAGLPPRL
jgi:hypothetical protein